MFFLLFLFFLFLTPFLMLFPFILYLSFHHVFTIHFYLTSLLFRHLLPFTSEEDSGRNLLSSELHCSDHFLINAANKAIVYHLLWMQQATPGQKFPYCPLTSTLFRSWLPLRIPKSTMIHFISSLSGFFPWARGLQYFHINVATFRLPPRSSGQYCDPSTSSSVLKQPQ